MAVKHTGDKEYTRHARCETIFDNIWRRSFDGLISLAKKLQHRALITILKRQLGMLKVMFVERKNEGNWVDKSKNRNLEEVDKFSNEIAILIY